MYTTSNFRHLRISKTKVLPVNLLLSKEDLEWFNDYSFQEILSILKPLILGRIDLLEQGHIVRNGTTSTSGSDDGLDDAGVIFGTNTNEDNGIGDAASSSDPKGKKRRGGASIRGKNLNRPQFTVRYGMKQIANSERGGTVLVADKNLGFATVKKEHVDDDSLQYEQSQRSQTDLASLEGEEQTDVAGVVIREEDESDNLRVSDFVRGEDDGDQDDNDGEYQESGVKRKQSKATTKRGRKDKRLKPDQEDSSSQMDQKPTLQVNYSSLKIFPQTLYIVVRSVDSKEPLNSILPFFTPTPIADSISNESNTENTPKTPEGDSLFPPGMDYFLS